MKRRRNIFLASLIALALALAPTALAAKGGGKANNALSTSTILLSAGPYSFGGSVSARTNVSADLMPWISMSCTQNGEVVVDRDSRRLPRRVLLRLGVQPRSLAVMDRRRGRLHLLRRPSERREGRHGRQHHDSRRRLTGRRIGRRRGPAGPALFVLSAAGTQRRRERPEPLPLSGISVWRASLVRGRRRDPRPGRDRDRRADALRARAEARPSRARSAPRA